MNVRLNDEKNGLGQLLNWKRSEFANNWLTRGKQRSGKLEASTIK